MEELDVVQPHAEDDPYGHGDCQYLGGLGVDALRSQLYGFVKLMAVPPTPIPCHPNSSVSAWGKMMPTI